MLVLLIVLNFLSGLFASLLNRGLLVTPFVSLRWDLGLVAGKCDKVNKAVILNNYSIDWTKSVIGKKSDLSQHAIQTEHQPYIT